LNYHPHPIDTSSIVLSPDLLGLTERLAENTHEVWAEQRMADGWKYGPRRDDVAREHPGLVPYDRLVESEKQYDRNTVVETLKAIIALGFHIGKPKAAPIVPPADPAASI
jgi:hypothetical protein